MFLDQSQGNITWLESPRSNWMSRSAISTSRRI